MIETVIVIVDTHVVMTVGYRVLAVVAIVIVLEIVVVFVEIAEEHVSAVVLVPPPQVEL